MPGPMWVRAGCRALRYLTNDWADFYNERDQSLRRVATESTLLSW